MCTWEWCIKDKTVSTYLCFLSAQPFCSDVFGQELRWVIPFLSKYEVSAWNSPPHSAWKDLIEQLIFFNKMPKFNENANSAAYVGYRYGAIYNYIRANPLSNAYFGNGFEWDGNSYTLNKQENTFVLSLTYGPNSNVLNLVK